MLRGAWCEWYPLSSGFQVNLILRQLDAVIDLGLVPGLTMRTLIAKTFLASAIPTPTQHSTTGPDARFCRKNKGQEARLSFKVHALADTKSRVIVAASATGPREKGSGGGRPSNRSSDS